MNKKFLSILCVIILMLIAYFSQYIVFNENEIFRYEQHVQKSNVGDFGGLQNDDLISHLPLIKISTNGQKIPGKSIHNRQGIFQKYETGLNDETEIKVKISIFDDKEERNSIKNNPTVETDAFIRVRGKSSRGFDKSSYKITFVNNENVEAQYKVMDMGSDSEWVLNGPFLDKTLMRNYMWMNISAKIMGYAPNVRFCECYVDDKYQGLYVMMESIKKSVNRVNLSNYDPDDRIVPYLIKMDKQEEDDFSNIDTFSYYTSHLDFSTGFSILYPGVNKLTDKAKEYIENDISAFEKALYSYDFNDLQKGYQKFIDVKSWIDFYIIEEFLANSDMCSFSTYMYRDKGKKLTMGPVWDFNNVCDNYTLSQYNPEGFYFTTNRIWYEMLFKDKMFVENVKKRYKELRSTYLKEEYLIKYIDDVIIYLGDAINRNYEIWGYTFESKYQNSKLQYLQPISRNPSSYEEAINKYKEFIIARGKWLDENLESLDQYCHPSRNKLFLK